MSIMMISRTSMTSTSGVTLISALRPVFALPTSIAIKRAPLVDRRPSDGRRGQTLRCLLDKVVDKLRRRVVHLDVEVLDAARQVVVEPDRGDRDDETERGFDERFRDTGGDGAETARTGGRDALERGDDADDRAEQSTKGAVAPIVARAATP